MSQIGYLIYFLCFSDLFQSILLRFSLLFLLCLQLCQRGRIQHWRSPPLLFFGERLLDVVKNFIEEFEELFRFRSPLVSLFEHVVITYFFELFLNLRHRFDGFVYLWLDFLEKFFHIFTICRINDIGIILLYSFEKIHIRGQILLQCVHLRLNQGDWRFLSGF